MLTENEVAQLLEVPQVNEVVRELHQTFITTELSLQDISLHDFFSGLLLAPSVALAQVDGTTSLFEELSLNKKARRFSKGGFLLQHDPVVKMIIHLQSCFASWEQQFLTTLTRVVQVVVPELKGYQPTNDNGSKTSSNAILQASYILVKLLETFFLPEGEELCNKRRVSNIEYQKISSIADCLQLSSIGSFQHFIQTFEVK